MKMRRRCTSSTWASPETARSRWPWVITLPAPSSSWAKGSHSRGDRCTAKDSRVTMRRRSLSATWPRSDQAGRHLRFNYQSDSVLAGSKLIERLVVSFEKLSFGLLNADEVGVRDPDFLERGRDLLFR